MPNYLIALCVPDVPEDRLDSLLKTINKDTPLINNNLNECNSIDINNKTDGIVFFTMYIIRHWLINIFY